MLAFHLLLPILILGKNAIAWQTEKRDMQDS